MISCRNCTTQNSLDSTFCKKCGATLPADDVQRAKEKLEAAVGDGYKVFTAGRTDEAMQIAEAAVQSNPNSTAALSLKAMCHERLGQISEALECHERVLALDPDSMIDKIKVNDLRNLLISRGPATTPDRRMAIVSAVAAFVLVVSIGVVVAQSGSKGPDKVAVNTPAPNVQQGPVGSKFEQPGPATTTQPPVAGTTQPTSESKTPSPSSPPAESPGRDSSAKAPDTQLPPYSRPDGASKLPRPDGGGLSGNIPFRVNVPPGVNGSTPKPTPTEQPVPSHATDPDPVTSDSQAAPPKQEAPGIMEIKIVSRGGKQADGTESGNRSNGVEALVRTARNQYQLGNYSAAATSFERALRAGADPASGNQRLAQCYEKLGRNAEAAAAYNRAIDAIQADISAGRGEKDRLGAALDSCRQALKVLGG